MDLRRTDKKQQNKNVNRLTFVFENVNKVRWKQEVQQMCLNGITCKGAHRVKEKVKEVHFSQIIFCLANVIYYVYECERPIL